MLHCMDHINANMNAFIVKYSNSDFVNFNLVLKSLPVDVILISFNFFKVKAFLADPTAFAVAAAPAVAAVTAAAPAAAAEPVKEESEESDEDMGFGLFD